MRTSERAARLISEMPAHDRPVSEEYRIVAKQWCQLDGAARMLEECKTAVLSQMMKRMGNVPAAHAERDVKASDEWTDYLTKMVEARTAANEKKVQMKYIEMRFNERQSADASMRTEARLTRG